MELKNAVAVCLISLFSATLVMLIARSLDSQAASRLEPQLARIVEQLQAIRTSGGVSTGSGIAAENALVQDAVMVYYFHGSVRCPTCRSIESQARQTVETSFATEAESGRVIWKVLDYEQPSGMELGKKFEVQMPVVVVARMVGGQIEDWKRLDQVWALVGDQAAFADLVRDQIHQMLPAADTANTFQATPAAPDIPVADAGLREIPLPPTADGLDSAGSQERGAPISETAGGQPRGDGQSPSLSLPLPDSAQIPIPAGPADGPVPQ